MERTACFCGVVLVAGTCAGQVGVIDQVSEWREISFPSLYTRYNVSEPTLIWFQQIRAGLRGQLEGIEVGSWGPAGAQCAIRIRSGTVAALGPVLFEVRIEKQTDDPEEPIFVDMTGHGFHAAAGQAFVLEAHGNGTGMWLHGSSTPSRTAPPLYPEPLGAIGARPEPKQRLGFTTYVLVDGRCYPDCDDSGALDLFDYLCFLNAFATGDVRADCDFDGSLSPQDLHCFSVAFALGCG
ncbi:MAG: hypothetical protein ACF8R7_13165 [Phycisphaerales bacterium JB039]